MVRKHSRPEVDEEQQIARYAYVLGSVPASVADHAYAFAFMQLSTEQRLDILGQLLVRVPVAPEGPPSDEPEAFAVFMRSLHARDALVGIRGAARLAAAFVSSPPVVAYFTVGVGSVSIDQHPPWVHQLAHHVTAPIDGGTQQPGRGVNSGAWFA